MRTSNILRILIPILIFLIFVSFVLSCTGSSPQEEPAKEEIAVTEVVEEKLLVQGDILKGQEYNIDGEEIKIEIPSSSLVKDDIISVSKLPNPVAENENAIFSDYVYSVDFNESLYFNEPITLILQYDEGMIPEDSSELSVFSVFEYEGNKVFYQGGEINTDDNTITVETLHASRWWSGILKRIMRIPNGDVVPESNIEPYSEKRLPYIEEAVQLILDDPNFDNVKYAKDEWERQWKEVLGYWYTAEITIEKLEGVNPASTTEELIDFAVEEGINIAAGEIINVIPAMLVQIGFTSGVGVLKIAGNAVGLIGAIQHGILIGENIGWSVLTVEKVLRLKNALRRWRIISTAWDYLASMGSFLIDVGYAREIGVDIPQEKVDKVLEIIKEARDSKEGQPDEEPAQEPESEPEEFEESEEQSYRPISSYTISIIYGPEKEGNLCVYRSQLSIGGDYLSISWNRDDSGGNWGAKVAQVNLNYGESFELIATIEDHYGNIYTIGSGILDNPYKKPSSGKKKKSGY